MIRFFATAACCLLPSLATAQVPPDSVRYLGQTEPDRFESTNYIGKMWPSSTAVAGASSDSVPPPAGTPIRKWPAEVLAATPAAALARPDDDTEALALRVQILEEQVRKLAADLAAQGAR
jgi:hypothetical protein